MELLQLQYFCDAAKNLNLSKTARKYMVPPSNISQSVKRLEKELGCKLFIRQSNKITLSETGERFYKKISKALNIINEATSEFSDDGTTGTITISINSNRRTAIEAIKKFKAKYPAVNIKTAYFGNLLEEEYDIIIDSNSNSINGYQRELLLNEDIALAVNINNPLAKLDKIEISMLSEEKFISMDNKASMYKVTNEICRKSGFEPKIALQSDDPALVRKCVEHGLGIAFAPTLSWKDQFSENVILKRLGYTRDIYVYLRTKGIVPFCAKNFLLAIKQEFECLKK